MPESINIPSKTQVLYVIFTAEINPTTVERLTAVMVQAAKKHVEKVYLAFSTPGGQVQAGIALYNTLAAMPFELTLHNIGSVNSMGNVVFLAGTTRYATNNATFMFHGVGTDIKGPVRIDEQYARERLDGILADQKRLGQIIVGRSGLNDDEIAELFRAQRTCDSHWANDNGLIEDIREFKIPKGSTVVHLVFQR